MIPKHLQVYYAGLVYDSTDNSGYIYIQPTSFSYSNYWTNLNLLLQVNRPNDDLKLEYNSFASDILSNTYLSVLQDFSIHDRVSYNKFNVSVQLSETDLETREFIYDQTIDNPVELSDYSDTVEQPRQSFNYSNYNSCYSFIVTGLPNAIGIVKWDSVNNTQCLIPSSESGWFSSMLVSETMQIRYLESICFGLLTSCVYKDYDLIIIQLKEFVFVSKQLGHVIQDSAGVWILNPESSYGFYPTLDMLNYTSEYDFKELPYNCLLLVALCSAIRCITDAVPTFEYNFDGSWGEFKEQLMVCLKAQALFVANSVSPVNNLCAYRTEGEYYQYSVLSYSASCYACVGLASYLSYAYDGYIHTQGAKLQATITDYPTDVYSAVHTRFVERDLELITLLHEEGITDNVEYNKSLAIAARLFWSYYYDLDSVSFLLDQYQSGYIISDSMLTVVLSSLEETLPDYIDLTTAMLAIQDRNNFVALAGYEEITLDTNITIAQIFAASVVEQGYKLVENYFDLVGIKASAFVTAMLLELRRMMPFGMKWFDQSKVNDISSVIGSMLYAEADLYWSWAVQLDACTKSASALTAVSEDAAQWFNNKYNLNILASDGFFKHLQDIDNNKNIVALQDLCDFLSSFLGIGVTYTRPTVPNFCIYKPNSTNDILSNYTANNQTLDLDLGYLNKDQYLSVVYKRQAANWIQRIIPGFPIKPSHKPVDVPVVTAEVYLANPTIGVVVQDGPVYIYPLQNYLMQTTLTVSEVTKQLSLALNKASPVGLDLKYQSTLEFVGEE